MTMMNLEEFKFTPENPSYPTFAYPPTPQSYRSLSFKQGIDTRDEIDGKQCCIVCGTTLSLRHAHILPPEDVAGHFIWLKLKETQEIPQWAQGVEEEPRNGLSLCATHHVAFDHYQFYIRYVPSPLDRFILINISTHPDLSQFHGKAIFLNPAHRIVPFPQLLYIHEYSARAQYASLDSPVISSTVVYPNWLRFSGGGHLLAWFVEFEGGALHIEDEDED